ncbi:MAG: type II secretion system secretin GspD [Mailhella sp.]|nr:type II secretion system secretin GspD [Mailhella sp.]
MTTIRIYARNILLALGLSLALPILPGGHAWAEPAAAPQERGLTLDFKEADIHELIRYMSESTGRNIIADPRVKGKVTVYSPVAISQDEAFELFVSIMRVHEYAVLRSGAAYKVVPIKDGLGQSESSATGRSPAASGETLVTRIVPLKVGSAAELAKVLPAILGRDSAISAYPPSNTLAVTAQPAAVNKALEFIREVEKGRHGGSALTLPLTHGDAKTLAENLSRVLKSRDEEAAKKGLNIVSHVTADERTNTLLVYGDEEALSIASRMVAELDIPTPKGKGDVHLIKLANARAEDLAAVLNTLVERQQMGAESEKSKDVVLSRDIKVVADKSTNSLLVTARPDEFDALREVVSRLDVLRRQVFIEALIMEVNSDASFSFGINWALGGDLTSNSVIAGGVNLGGSSIGLGGRMVSLPSGVSIGTILKDAFTVGNTSYSIPSVINAVRGNNDVQILATPQLLTLDNEEASVEVVDNVPFTKESTTRNDNDFTTQSMDYKDVGVKLKITPRIGTEDSLRLEVDQEISRVTSGLITLANGDQLVAPTTRKRAVKTTILLQDNQTAVIGGLLDDSKEFTENKVPGLGDVPVLGWLFKSRSTSAARTNLFIFITPRIIRSAEESSGLTMEKRRRIHETSVGRDGLGLPSQGRPKLMKPVFVR